MLGRAESLAGLPGLSFSREVVAMLPGPQPALGAWPAPGPCKQRPLVSCGGNCKLKNQNLAIALTAKAGGMELASLWVAGGVGRAPGRPCSAQSAPMGLASDCQSTGCIQREEEALFLIFAQQAHGFILPLPSGDVLLCFSQRCCKD